MAATDRPEIAVCVTSPTARQIPGRIPRQLFVTTFRKCGADHNNNRVPSGFTAADAAARGESVAMDSNMLPGSRACIGCHGLTFRNRADGLCPRCAFHAESLIEQIELDSLEHDLTLMTRFEAYCEQRDRIARRAALGDRPATPLGNPGAYASSPEAGSVGRSPWSDIPRTA
jgi:hypothetical protein